MYDTITIITNNQMEPYDRVSLRVPLRTLIGFSRNLTSPRPRVLLKGFVAHNVLCYTAFLLLPSLF